jgi:hypothetical protein
MGGVMANPSSFARGATSAKSREAIGMRRPTRDGARRRRAAAARGGRGNPKGAYRPSLGEGENPRSAWDTKHNRVEWRGCSQLCSGVGAFGKRWTPLTSPAELREAAPLKCLSPSHKAVKEREARGQRRDRARRCPNPPQQNENPTGPGHLAFPQVSRNSSGNKVVSAISPFWKFPGK